MKLHTPARSAYNTFTAYGDGFVEVNERRFDSSILVVPEGEVTGWPPRRFEDLSVEHFAAVAQLKPELVLFGSGPRLRFPPARLLQPLTDLRIGVETMDVHAACRTYNILMAEGRKVAAALLIEVR